jgi:hypothetical protein
MCLAELDDLIQCIAEFFNARQGDYNRVTATADFLDNSQEAASRIFAELERDVLPLDPDAVTLEVPFYNCRDSPPKLVAIRTQGSAKIRPQICHVAVSHYRSTRALNFHPFDSVLK